MHNKIRNYIESDTTSKNIASELFESIELDLVNILSEDVKKAVKAVMKEIGKQKDEHVNAGMVVVLDALKRKGEAYEKEAENKIAKLKRSGEVDKAVMGKIAQGWKKAMSIAASFYE